MWPDGYIVVLFNENVKYCLFNKDNFVSSRLCEIVIFFNHTHFLMNFEEGKKNSVKYFLLHQVTTMNLHKLHFYC
jgi:hypothetical protein